MSADEADTCDVCRVAIAFGETCYLVPTGETFDGVQVVTVQCAPCRAAG